MAVPGDQPLTKSGPRAEIINTVQRPLGFFVLVVLVVEVALSIVAGLSAGHDRTYAVVGMLVLIFMLVLLVAAMAIWRPESLQGARPSSPLLPKPAVTTDMREVQRLSKPAVLCGSSKDYEDKGFDKDVEI